MKKLSHFPLIIILLLSSCTEEIPDTELQKPKAGFSFEVDPQGPLSVQFTNSSENADEYAWDFGDDIGSSTDENPAYTYDEEGTYTVTLTATGDGGTVETFKSVTVTAPEDGSSDPITANRWKYTDVWEDYCEIETQTIQGYEFLTFRPDFTILFELELFGETHGCTGDSEEMGTWERNGNEYIITADEDDVVVGRIDGDQLCWTEDDGEIVCWNKE